MTIPSASTYSMKPLYTVHLTIHVSTVLGSPSTLRPKGTRLRHITIAIKTNHVIPSPLPITPAKNQLRTRHEDLAIYGSNSASKMNPSSPPIVPLYSDVQYIGHALVITSYGAVHRTMPCCNAVPCTMYCTISGDFISCTLVIDEVMTRRHRRRNGEWGAG